MTMLLVGWGGFLLGFIGMALLRYGAVPPGECDACRVRLVQYLESHGVRLPLQSDR